MFIGTEICISLVIVKILFLFNNSKTKSGTQSQKMEPTQKRLIDLDTLPFALYETQHGRRGICSLSHCQMARGLVADFLQQTVHNKMEN